MDSKEGVGESRSRDEAVGTVGWGFKRRAPSIGSLWPSLGSLVNAVSRTSTAGGRPRRSEMRPLPSKGNLLGDIDEDREFVGLFGLYKGIFWCDLKFSSPGLKMWSCDENPEEVSSSDMSKALSDASLIQPQIYKPSWFPEWKAQRNFLNFSKTFCTGAGALAAY